MSENPYAPPLVEPDVPSAPPSHGWRFENEELIVEKEAMLPMVDPYNGRTSDRMFLYPLVIRSNSSLLRIISTSLAIIFFSSMILSKTGKLLPEFFPALIFSHIIALVVFYLLSSNLKVFIFLTSETQEKLRKERLFSLVTSPLMAVSGVLIGYRGGSISNISAIVLATLVFARIARSFAVSRPTCRRVSSDEFRLRNIHPEAIAYLKRYSSSQIRSIG